MESYQHRLDNMKSTLKEETAKQAQYEGASRAADKLIVQEKERIAREDKEIAAKKAADKRSSEFARYLMN